MMSGLCCASHGHPALSSVPCRPLGHNTTAATSMSSKPTACGCARCSTCASPAAAPPRAGPTPASASCAMAENRWAPAPTAHFEARHPPRARAARVRNRGDLAWRHPRPGADQFRARYRGQCRALADRSDPAQGLGQPANGFSLQGGVMNLPFSLEHVGPAWSPEFTITPSAPQQLAVGRREPRGPRRRVVARDLQVACASARSWARAMGRIAWRACSPCAAGRWATASAGSTATFRCPTAPSASASSTSATTARRLLRCSRSATRAEIASLKVGHFDNSGDQNTGRECAHTRFTVVGVTLHPHPSIDVLAQYLDGEAYVAGAQQR